MTEPPDPVLAARPWLEKAEHDLLAAEHDLKLADQGLTDIACFHCQQCAEKYLKALLVYRGIPFPKTHDLRHLMDLVPLDTPLDLDRARVLPLNRYVIEGRYPGEWEPITKQEAVAAIAMARSVRDAVRQFLPEAALQGIPHQ